MRHRTACCKAAGRVPPLACEFRCIHEVRRGLTRKEFLAVAEKRGISRETLTDILTGKKVCTPRMLERIIQALQEPEPEDPEAGEPARVPLFAWEDNRLRDALSLEVIPISPSELAQSERLYQKARASDGRPKRASRASRARTRSKARDH